MIIGEPNVSEKNSNAGPNVYGFALPKNEATALRKKTQEKFGIPSTQYMRMVVKAILEDRLTITKPKDQEGVYKS